MIYFKNLFVLLVLSSLIFYSCKDDSNPSDPGTPPNQGYFPNGDGNYYKYDIEKIDSVSSVTVGERSTMYSGTQVLGGVSYQKQIDSLIYPVQSTSNLSYFRKTDTGVFYFLDTAGLAEIIPDTLMQYITFDGEFRMMKFPFTSGDNWPVFKMNFTYSILSINIIEVTAYYEGDEDITINLTSGQTVKKAAKVKYELTLKIPDPSNPLIQRTSKYSAFAWFVDSIGPAKWEGNATVLNAFAGGEIDFDDTTSTLTQNLKDYTIK